jgi:hypothetical protein
MTEAEIEAAPCPFCGGPAKTLPYNGTMQATCAADYQKCAGSDVLAPIGMWNQRTALAVAEAVRKVDLVPGLERAREIVRDIPCDRDERLLLDEVLASISIEIAKATEAEGG